MMTCRPFGRAGHDPVAWLSASPLPFGSLLTSA